MKAKKSLGQHFLKSEKALSQIVEASVPTSKDIILEIGPGHGVLTEHLLRHVGKVVAVEKDKDLIPILEEKFAQEILSGKLLLLHADILKLDLSTLRPLLSTYKLVANIPYYITGAIIEKFLSTPHQPTLMVLLMQKEVAERIIARDPVKRQGRNGAGNKESILSIAVKAYGVPKIVGKVPPGAFVPPPTVDSAILSVTGISRDFFTDCDETLFFSVLKAVFGKKRKQIGGSLADFLGDKDRALSALRSVDIDPKTRPEDITLQTWKKLAQALEKNARGVVQ